MSPGPTGVPGQGRCLLSHLKGSHGSSQETKTVKWRKKHLPSCKWGLNADVPAVSPPSTEPRVHHTGDTHVPRAKGYLTLDTQTWVHRPWVHRPEQS